MTVHASDLQWDRLLADDLAADAQEAARGHAAGCACCAARLRMLTAERDAFAAREMEIAVPRQRLWWCIPSVPLAAAVAVLIAVWARPRDDKSREQTKGRPRATGPLGAIVEPGPILLLSVGRPGALRPVASGGVVQPGDYLQAGYTAYRDGFGAVLSRDGAGSVAAYVPARGDALAPLAAGVERSFPQSTVLDSTLGDERIVILWCETAYMLAPLLAPLRANQAISAPEDCVTREATLEKRNDATTRKGLVWHSL